MTQDHPCLQYSKMRVQSRMRNNHNGHTASVNNDEDIIRMVGQKMQLANIQKIIKSIIKQSNQ